MSKDNQKKFEFIFANWFFCLTLVKDEEGLASFDFFAAKLPPIREMVFCCSLSPDSDRRTHVSAEPTNVFSIFEARRKRQNVAGQ